MRRMHFLLMGMLLFSSIAMNFTSQIGADDSHGTRSPGAGIEITAPSNDTGKPTETISYIFIIKNVGDEIDSFILSVVSSFGWETDLSSNSVGPLNVDESFSVIANITIPMGIPASTIDTLSLFATSNIDQNVTEQANVSTTVDLSFIVEIDIEGDTSWISGMDPPESVNYTLTLRNKGNEDVTITLKYISTNGSWDVIFSKFPDVSVLKADEENEGIKCVNITVTAPPDTKPNETMNLTVWGEKLDRNWYSYDYQDNITITTIVQRRIKVVFKTDDLEGFARSGETLYDFTLENTGNVDMKIDFIIKWPNILIINLNHDQMIVKINDSTQNTLRVRTASDAPLGNYTINISAVDNSTGESIAFMELCYIILPVLNITNISIADKEPMQYRNTYVFVTIENIGYIDATNITVKLYDGSKKVGETLLESLNASDTTEAKIKWAPSDYGNRSIRLAIDVEGVGNFSEHGTDIAEKTMNLTVKINWEPYYLAIYIIIVIILGIATFSSLITLRYYGARPHLNDYGEGVEDMGYEDFPEEGELPEGGAGAEEPFAPFGVTREREDQGELLRYEQPERKRYRPPPEPRKEPIEPEIPPPLVLSKDRETERKEDELKDEMWRVQDRLDKTKALGVDTTNIDQLIKTAKKSLNEGNYNKAKQYIGYANDRLGNLMAKREEALEAIKEAKDLLSGMRGTADVTIVENFLVKADSLFKEGDFREAKNYAQKAKDRAVRLQRQEMRL